MTIGIIQPDIVSNEIEKNLDNCEKLIKSLSGVRIFLLPEMFATGFPATREQAEQAETGNIQTWMKRVAQETNAVVAGTLAVKETVISPETLHAETLPAETPPTTQENEKIYNRLIWMRPSGEYFTYDKKHLFGAEKIVYQSGSNIVTINESGWNFRLNICYDLRFPIWCKNRRLYGDTLDYDIGIYLSSWPVPRINVWKALLPARAIENIAYTIGVNRTGKDTQGTRYNGQSIVSDVMGNVTLLDKNPQAYKIVLEKEVLDKWRRHITVAHDWDEFKM
ncbi:MAG: hypothetical protein LBQ31_05740 [Bacteroidales bacterium]|jgi:predicted amidohydrolase|nr:hypothetical protein [Bacteroidales bacterium]